MPSLAAAKAANAATKLPFAPVAVFVGATSGIGEGATEAFARYSGTNARIIISGRNEAAAKALIDRLPKDNGATYEFLKCDASTLANVKTATTTLKEKHGLTKINYLFMSPGFYSAMGGFDDNGEGIDKKFALHFYSRFKFFTELAPLLQAAKDAGEEARVVSVLGAGYGSKLNASDLGLTKSYSVLKCGQQSPTYSSLLIEELAKKYPALSFTHISPGFIDTNIMKTSIATRIMGVVFSPLMTSTADCSEWMARTLYDPAFAKGAHHLNNHADPVAPKKLYLDEADQKTVYDHFMEISSKF